jgi:hypothetical protein
LAGLLLVLLVLVLAARLFVLVLFVFLVLLVVVFFVVVLIIFIFVVAIGSGASRIGFVIFIAAIGALERKRGNRLAEEFSAFAEPDAFDHVLVGGDDRHGLAT